MIESIAYNESKQQLLLIYRNLLIMHTVNVAIIVDGTSCFLAQEALQEEEKLRAL
jgi:hypothetical protein